MSSQQEGSAPTLKPCPFCGGTPMIMDDGVDETRYKAISCASCQCGTAFESDTCEAARKWNTRTEATS